VQLYIVGQEDGTASLCQILSKSILPWPRYRDFSISQDGGRPHVGFLKFQSFNGRKGQEGMNELCKQLSVPAPRGAMSEFDKSHLPQTDPATRCVTPTAL